MRIKIQVIIETVTENGPVQQIEEIANLERTTLQPASLGLSLIESKEITAGIQKALTARQVTEFSLCP
jgi:hypothetical protein